MMQAMKGATMALGSMNRTMNLPSLQRIAMEFERENDIMEQRQEMMDDAIDDAMDVGEEDESEEVVEQILEEIGVDLSQSVIILSSPVYRLPPANIFPSWARHLQGYNPTWFQKAKLHRQLVVVVGLTQVTTIFKHGWIAYGDERCALAGKPRMSYFNRSVACKCGTEARFFSVCGPGFPNGVPGVSW
jgi:Snf7